VDKEAREPVEVFDLGVAEMAVKTIPGEMKRFKCSQNDKDSTRILTIGNIPGQGSWNLILFFPSGKSCRAWMKKAREAQTNIGLDDVSQPQNGRRVSVDNHYCDDLNKIAEDAEEMGYDPMESIKDVIEGTKEELGDTLEEYDFIRNDLSNQTSQCEARNEQIKAKENEIQQIKQQIYNAQPQKKYKYIIPSSSLSHENDLQYKGARRGSVSAETCQNVARKRVESRLRDWMRFDTEREVEFRPRQLIDIARLENKKIEALTVDSGRAPQTISPAQQKMLKTTPQEISTPNLPSFSYPRTDNRTDISNPQYELATHTVKVSRSGYVSEVTPIWGPDKLDKPGAKTLEMVSQSTEQVFGQDTVDTLATHLDRLQSKEAFRQQSDPNEMLQLLRLFEEPMESDPRNDGKPKGPYKWGNVDPTLLGACILSIAEQAQKLLITEPRLLRITSPSYTFGDFHGNYSDLVAFERLFWRLGPKCTPSNFLFLGNYVDGGDNGLEVVVYLLSQKLIAPQNFFLLRGQHELRNVQELSTFKKECMSKLGQALGLKVWKAINQCFDVMPLSAVIDDKIFCAHGGIPAPYHKGGYLAEYDIIPHELPDPLKTSPLAVQVMLSEPLAAAQEAELTPEKKEALVESGGFLLNKKRGEGAYFFSRRALESFLKRNGLSHMIRSNEMKEAGFQIQQNSRLLNVFSSSGYQDGINQAACVLVDCNKIRVFRVDKDSLEKGPLVINDMNPTQTLQHMPRVTFKNETEIKTMYPDENCFDLAMHTVNVQRSGSIKEVAVLYGSDNFYNPDLMSLSAAQICKMNEKAQKEMRSKSVEAFNDNSDAHELLHLLRFFEQPLECGPGGKPKEALDWGSVDTMHLTLCLAKVCQKAMKLLGDEPKLMHLTSPTHILGDLHGNYPDLVSFEKLLWPMGPNLTPGNFLFLGDFVDRGDYSLEVVAYVFAHKVISPDKVFLLRGNHEDRFIQKQFSFYTECKAKLGDDLGKQICEIVNRAFDVMPLAATIDGKLFCVHGGIPTTFDDGGFLSEFDKLPREIKDPHKELFAMDVMWNDPLLKEDLDNEETAKAIQNINDTNDGFTENTVRGQNTWYFTSYALDQFLERNNLSHVIRAHQVKDAGFKVQKCGKLLTVFSSSDYRGTDNQAACILADRNKIRSIRIDLARLDGGYLKN